MLQPRGRDLYVPMALIPWVALEVEIGVSVTVVNALMVVLIIKHMPILKFGVFQHQAFVAVGVIILISLLAAVYTLEFGPNVPSFAGGATLRNGYGRVATTLVQLSILFIYIGLLLQNKNRIDPLLIFKLYVVSCSILCILAIFQFSYFKATGIDIFPIGLFADEEMQRSATVALGTGGGALRVSSLGGEPKGFGLSLAIAIALSLSLGSRIVRNASFRKLMNTLLIVTIILTASTSAFIVLLIMVIFYLAFKKVKEPFSKLSITLSMIFISFMILAVFYGMASTTKLTAPVIYRSYESNLDIILYKAIENIRLDDTDAIIWESFVGDHFGLLFGRGLGLVHHYAYLFIPFHQEHYLLNSIVAPKSGVSFFVGNAGILGLFLASIAMAKLVPHAPPNGIRLSQSSKNLIGAYQALSFGLAASVMLRLYTFDITWILLAVFYIARSNFHNGPFRADITLSKTIRR